MKKGLHRFDVKDKVCVVTGATGGLGSELARVLHRAGGRVALVARTQAKLDALAKELAAEGGEKPLTLVADVTDEKALRKACSTLVKKWGPPSVLVNGAGGNRREATADSVRFNPAAKDPMAGSFFRLPASAWNEVMNLNFAGVLLPSIVFGEPMAAAGRGVIVNISSMSALRPLTKVGAYSAAKSAMTNLTQWLAVHLAPAGIRVNALAPGFFSTEQNRFLLHGPDGKTLTPRAEQILAHTPMSRFGAAEDLAGALLYLASDSSAFVTGIVLPVDGGFSAFAGV